MFDSYWTRKHLITYFFDIFLNLKACENIFGRLKVDRTIKVGWDPKSRWAPKQQFTLKMCKKLKIDELEKKYVQKCITLHSDKDCVICLNSYSQPRKNL